jgi:hypothetical protein
MSLHNFKMPNFRDINEMHFIGGKNDIFTECSDKSGQWKLFCNAYFIVLDGCLMLMQSYDSQVITPHTGRVSAPLSCPYILIYIQQDATLHILFYLGTALHVLDSTITHHLECKQPYLQHLVFVTHSTLKPVTTLPRWRQIAVTVWQIPDALDTVVCAPDDGWKYHPKRVEKFPDKIKCVTLHLVGYIYIRILLRCTDSWMLIPCFMLLWTPLFHLNVGKF